VGGSFSFDLHDEFSLSSCEKYSISEDKWENIPCLKKPLISMNLIAIESKYLYAIGGL
jgi:hypothetical protein